MNGAEFDDGTVDYSWRECVFYAFSLRDGGCGCGDGEFSSG